MKAGPASKTAKGTNRCPLLFVYGTLRRQLVPLPYRALMHSLQFEGMACLQARLHDVGDYPALTLSDDPQDQVTGELYRVEPGTPVLRRLDIYEGCAPGSPRPHEYERSILPVRQQDGAYVDAWVYVFRYPVDSLELIASGDYLQYRSNRR